MNEKGYIHLIGRLRDMIVMETGKKSMQKIWITYWPAWNTWQKRRLSISGIRDVSSRSPGFNGTQRKYSAAGGCVQQRHKPAASHQTLMGTGNEAAAYNYRKAETLSVGE